MKKLVVLLSSMSLTGVGASGVLACSGFNGFMPQVDPDLSSIDFGVDHAQFINPNEVEILGNNLDKVNSEGYFYFEDWTQNKLSFMAFNSNEGKIILSKPSNNPGPDGLWVIFKTNTKYYGTFMFNAKWMD